eukprot:363488-Chlamydomonas_euryale.AAC.15
MLRCGPLPPRDLHVHAVFCRTQATQLRGWNEPAWGMSTICGNGAWGTSMALSPVPQPHPKGSKRLCVYPHTYPPHAACLAAAVSVGVMRGPDPVAGCVVEFAGGPGTWVTRTYLGAPGRGATVNGAPIHVSGIDAVNRALLVRRPAALPPPPPAAAVTS